MGGLFVVLMLSVIRFLVKLSAQFAQNIKGLDKVVLIWVEKN